MLISKSLCQLPSALRCYVANHVLKRSFGTLTVLRAGHENPLVRFPLLSSASVYVPSMCQDPAVQTRSMDTDHDKGVATIRDTAQPGSTDETRFVTQFVSQSLLLMVSRAAGETANNKCRQDYCGQQREGRCR